MARMTRTTGAKGKPAADDELSSIASVIRNDVQMVRMGKARAEGASPELRHRAATVVCALELKALLAEGARDTPGASQQSVLQAIHHLSDDTTFELLCEVMAKLPSVAETERAFQPPMEAK